MATLRGEIKKSRSQEKSKVGDVLKLREGGVEAVSNAKLKGMQNYVVTAGNVGMMYTSCTTVRIRETPLSCCECKSLCCSFCGDGKNEAMLFHCGACKCVSYCGKKCQVDDWGRYKPICRAISNGCLKRRESGTRASLVDVEDPDVYATYITPREKEKAAKLIGNKCIILCKLNGVEIPALLDTGAQVSIICLQHVKKYLKGTPVNKIEDLLDPGASLELKTANGQLFLTWAGLASGANSREIQTA